MAMCVKSIARTSFNLLSKNVFQQLAVTATRQLYSPLSLGINGYLNARDYVKSQFTNVDHLFFDKMKDFVKKPDAMIFTEDLKTMMHLVEKKPELLELMYEMMQKYNSQNNLRFGSFVFGTVAMRALYHLDEPDLALKVFKDPLMENFFDQIMTHQILMDLLYNHGRYADVREVYDIIKVKNINGIVHPKNPFIIVMGACYRENTKESFDYAVQLFKEVQTRGYEFPRRAITFLSALALKQNDSNTALEVASLARNVRYIDIRCLKIEAYALLKRFDEVMVYFRNTLQEDRLSKRKQCYFKDTFEKVEAIILEENFDENSEIMKLLKQIKLHDYVQPTLLDEHITGMIDHVKYNQNEQRPGQKSEFRSRSTNQRNYSDRFTKQGNFEGDNSYNRPGLRDIV